MPITEVFFLAFEALIANKLRAALTMLGMIIGVGAVVLLVSIGNGARNYVASEFESLGTNLIIIQPGRTDKHNSFGPPISGGKHRLTLADVEALQRQSLNVSAVSGLTFGTANVKYGPQETNVNVLGSNEELPRIFHIKVGLGQYFTHDEDETGRRVTVLGYNVAQNLFGDANALGELVKINDSEFRVIGVTEKQGQTLGFNMDDMVFIPTRAGMRLMNEDKLFGIRAAAKSRASVDDAVEEIRQILKARQQGDEDFTILTQVTMLETMNTILGMLTYVLGGIAMISMIVGGIGIMNIMLVSVTERTREIGIRRAVGARRSDILKQFLVEAIVLSVAGGMVGLGGSTFLTFVVYWIKPSFDMRAPVWILIPAFGLSVFIGVAFGVWPARKAAHLETIEALRYE